VRRTAWLTLGVLSVALGGTLWLLFGQGKAPPEPLRHDEIEVAPDVPAWMRLKNGTLTIGVRGSDGHVPTGAQVGFETLRGPRLYYVDPEGLRTLTDVPLGDVVVVAEAPGFERLKRQTRVEPGVPGELKIVLQPVAKVSPPR